MSLMMIGASAWRQGGDLGHSTWDASYIGNGVVLSNGGLDASTTGVSWRTVFGTLGRSSGKFAYEVIQLAGTSVNRPIMGIADKSNGIALQTTYMGNTGVANSIGLWGNGQIYGNLGSGTIRQSASSTSSNDVVTVAADLDNNTLEILLNGSSEYSSPIPSGLTWYPAASIQQTGAVRLRVTNLDYPQAGFSDWG